MAESSNPNTAPDSALQVLSAVAFLSRAVAFLSRDVAFLSRAVALLSHAAAQERETCRIMTIR